MFADCQEWRRTVEGVGIDELYRTLDPFDVSFFFLSFLLAGGRVLVMCSTICTVP